MLLKTSLQRNDATHFSACSDLVGEEKTIDFSAFSKKIGDISDKFDCRFAEFYLLTTKLEFFYNPIEVKIESQPSHVQQESCESQADPFLCQERMSVTTFFWKLVNKEQ